MHPRYSGEHQARINPGMVVLLPGPEPDGAGDDSMCSRACHWSEYIRPSVRIPDTELK